MNYLLDNDQKGYAICYYHYKFIHMILYNIVRLSDQDLNFYDAENMFL